MKTQLIVCASLILAACGDVQAKLNPKEATLKALRECMSSVQDREGMAIAVQSNAQSPTYAAEAKAGAEICATSARRLMAIQKDHPCLPLVRFHEGMNWTMASELEGKPAIESFSMTAGSLNDSVNANADACAAAAGSSSLDEINIIE